MGSIDALFDECYAMVCLLMNFGKTQPFSIFGRIATMDDELVVFGKFYDVLISIVIFFLLIGVERLVDFNEDSDL